MADPIGTPTFFQMFAPSKSPFHALSLFALICLVAIFKKPLADYGTGLLLVVLTASFCLAPFFRPRYTDRVYGLSLMFGRSAGVIGAMIALAVLIGGSVDPAQDLVGKLTSASPEFRLLRGMIVLQAAMMAFLFFFRTKSHGKESNRFNIIQFCLMQSTILIFAVIMATEVPLPSFWSDQILGEGGYILTSAFRQLFTPVHLPPANIVAGLVLLWCVATIVNILVIFSKCVQPGWITDHGDGSHE